jgi:anti-anti-sigma factor
LNVETLDVEGVAVLAPAEGELDLLGYQALGQEVDALLRGGHNKVILDLRQVSYVSSAAVRALLGARKRAAESGGLLAVARAEGGARAALEASGALSDLAVFKSVEDAVASLSA